MFTEMAREFALWVAVFCVVIVNLSIPATHGIPVQKSDKLNEVNESEDDREVVFDVLEQISEYVTTSLGGEYVPGRIDGTFEGDIILDAQQAIAILEQVTGITYPTSRKVRPGEEYMWDITSPIPYVFQPGDYTLTEMNDIRDGIHHWEEETCIRFQEIFLPPTELSDYIVFYKGSEQSCSSPVGRSATGPNKISLGTYCLNLGIIAHEIGHSLQFWHEQSRPDRDQFVDINEEYIMEGYEHNFMIQCQTDTFGLPYDYASDMHYDASEFSINAPYLPTVVPKDPRMIQTIGSRIGLSFYDAYAANLLYCSDICPVNSAECQRGGYPNPNDCSVCKCPDGFSGDFCEELTPTQGSMQCGGIILVTCGAKWTITAPGYPQMTTPQQWCTWLIKAPEKAVIVASFTELVVDNYDSKHYSCPDYVEIKYGPDMATSGARTCILDDTDQPYISATNEMMILLRTYSEHHSTFSLNYQAICSDMPTTPATSGSTSPSNPLCQYSTTSSNTAKPSASTNAASNRVLSKIDVRYGLILLTLINFCQMFT